MTQEIQALGGILTAKDVFHSAGLTLSALAKFMTIKNGQTLSGSAGYRTPTDRRYPACRVSYPNACTDAGHTSKPLLMKRNRKSLLVLFKTTSNTTF